MSHDGPLVALQCLQRDVGYLSLGLPQEHLAGGRQHLLVLPLDLHLKPEGKESLGEGWGERGHLGSGCFSFPWQEED